MTDTVTVTVMCTVVTVYSYGQHPYFCVRRLIDIFYDQKNSYLVLQFMAGGSLHDIIHLSQIGSLPPQLAKFYYAYILTAITFIHSQDIIHGDLKLRNILLGADGYPVLTDFGSTLDANDK
jgi:serine/threonine protein kinase